MCRLLGAGLLTLRVAKKLAFGSVNEDDKCQAHQQ